jgi:hypothetical protein
MVEPNIKRVKAGSAVYVSDETRNPATNALFAPDGGVKVSIYDYLGVAVVTAQVMTAVSTGKWAYSWQFTTASTKGMYTVVTTATHGSKASVKEDRKAFELY